MTVLIREGSELLGQVMTVGDKCNCDNEFVKLSPLAISSFTHHASFVLCNPVQNLRNITDSRTTYQTLLFTGSFIN